MPSISKLSLVCSIVLLAQSVSSQSGSSSFETSFFTPENTYTPPTNFETATSVIPTTLIGLGPSVTTGPATFVYSVPDATVGITTNSELYQSLASAGLPTAQGNDLSPPGDNLQIVGNQDGGALRQSVGVVTLLAAGMLAGAAVMLV